MTDFYFLALHEQLKAFVEEELEENIRRVQWNTNRLYKDFAQRSVKQILTDGDTSFIGACNDYTLLALDTLQKQGKEPRLLIEILKNNNPNNVKEGLHFAIDLPKEPIQTYLDFAHRTTVIHGKGEYRNLQPHVESQLIIPVEGPFDPEVPIIKSHERTFRKLGVNLEGYLQHITTINTQETFERYLEETQEQPVLTLFTYQEYLTHNTQPTQKHKYL